VNIERTPAGRLELRLSDDAERFRSIAETVRATLDGRWLEQVDGPDQSYWDLAVDGRKLTVHREHYLGVSIFCADEPASRALIERLQLELGRG
jgi:hypothetical protein